MELETTIISFQKGYKSWERILCYSIPFSLVFRPPSSQEGFLHYILLTQLILALHLLINPASTRVSVPSAAFPYLQWVAALQTALFRGPVFINAARAVVAGI